MNYTHNLSLTDYLKNSVPDLIGDRAKEYYQQYRQKRINSELYGGQKLPHIDHWRFLAYLHYVDDSASYEESLENANKLSVVDHLEFVIEANCPGIIRQLQQGNSYWNYRPKSENRESEDFWSSLFEDSDICTEVQIVDNIYSVAQRLREKLLQS